MRVTKKITKEQKAILRGFKCQRLTADPDNERLVYHFFSEKGGSLTGTLQEQAWKEDLAGTNAYYVVKNEDNDILLFFSLKCGVLYNPNYFKKVEKEFQEAKILYLALKKGIGPQWALDYIEELRKADQLDFMSYKIRSRYFVLQDIYDKLISEIETEQNQKIVRVDKTHAGIELVHFCANDWARDQWNSYGLGRSMGETLFWYFVVPKILQVNRYIGCEYVYLFAADISEDGNLLNYYKNTLHFILPQDIGATKPQYDFWCTFMCQHLNSLKQHREEFIKTFNRLKTSESI